MPRDFKVQLADMVEAAEKIESYIAALDFEAFIQDPKTIDAVVRNLEIIGEAAKKVPEEVRSKHVEIEWKKICGIRDILIHAYFAVDLVLVWNIAHDKIPRLRKLVQNILSS